MGIINMTPDSFNTDGYFRNPQKALPAALRQAQKLITQGADILDIGGESTRPGAKKVFAQQQRARVIPLIRSLAKKIKVPISIDTYKTDVAKAALDEGVSIVNNVRGTHIDKSFLKMVRSYDAALILMHSRGDSKTMQTKTTYKNLIADIIDELQYSLEICLEIGIKLDKMIVDPGIGFAKDAQQNLTILKRLSEFTKLNCPILIGPSRKSFIGQVLGADDPQDRLMGTAASVCAGIMNGAHIIRVHDVQPMTEIARMTDAIIKK